MLRKVIYGLIFIALQTNNCMAQALVLNGDNTWANNLGGCTGCATGEYQKNNAGTTVSGNCLNLTSSSMTNVGVNFWFCEPINLNQSFDLTFTGYFGTDDATGDGIAFVLKQGIDGCGSGGAGGNLGYSGGATPPAVSLATEFDTFNNAPTNNDVNCDHVSIQQNGDLTSSGTVAGPACANCGATTATDDDYLTDAPTGHTIRITWDPSTNQYTVYVDGEKVLSMGNIRGYFTDPTAVGFGFSAAVGGTAQVQAACGATMTTGGVIPAPCGGACCTLPVDLLYFNLEENNSSVLLSWASASERNNNYYEILRSSDAKSWISLEKINGAGNSSTNKYYEYTDNSPHQGINYYKLKQVDFDGKSDEFLRVINTENGKRDFSFQAYPIPATNELNITLDYSLKLEESTIEVELFNSLGQLVYSRKNISEHLITINTENYRKGLYQLVIKANDKIQNQKIIIQ